MYAHPHSHSHIHACSKWGQKFKKETEEKIGLYGKEKKGREGGRRREKEREMTDGLKNILGK